MMRLKALRTGLLCVSMVGGLVLGLGACYDAGEAIPSGLYLSEDGEERIVVDASRRIRVQVRLDETNPDRVFDREFESYSVWPESKRLQPHPMTYGEAFLWIGKFTWLWKGGKIAKTDHETGEVITWFEWQG